MSVAVSSRLSNKRHLKLLPTGVTLSRRQGNGHWRIEGSGQEGSALLVAFVAQYFEFWFNIVLREVRDWNYRSFISLIRRFNSRPSRLSADAKIVHLKDVFSF
jgi:hypothetical protein